MRCPLGLPLQPFGNSHTTPSTTGCGNSLRYCYRWPSLLPHPLQCLPHLGLQGLENVADAAPGVHRDEVVLLGQLAELVNQRALVADEVFVKVRAAQEVVARLPMVQLTDREHPG